MKKEHQDVITSILIGFTIGLIISFTLLGIITFFNLNPAEQSTITTTVTQVGTDGKWFASSISGTQNLLIFQNCYNKDMSWIKVGDNVSVKSNRVTGVTGSNSLNVHFCFEEVKRS